MAEPVLPASAPPEGWRVLSEELVGAAAVTAASPPPRAGLVDRLAAPAGFIAVTLVLDAPLEGPRLRAALEQVLALVPTLGCRALRTEDGDWRLALPPEAPAAGAMLTLGACDTLDLPAAAPSPPPARRPYTNALGTALFGHAPPAMPPDARAAALQPLFWVACYELAGASGAVLGARASHFVADFSTLALALRLLAAAYSGARPPPPSEAPLPAAPALDALAAAYTPLPQGFQPYNYLPAPPEVMARLGAAVAARAAGLRGVVYYVTPERMAELKARAVADLAEAAGGRGGGSGGGGGGAGKEEDGGSNGRGGRNNGGNSGNGESGGGGGAETGESGDWVSTHDALMAHVWTVVASLPSRLAANPTPLTLALDLRRRMPSGACGVPEADQGRLYGNLASTLFVPEMDVAAGGPGGGPMPLGLVARELRRALPRCAALFPRDIAHAARIVATPGGCRGTAILPVLRILQDTAAGRAPLLMTSTWPLDFQRLAFGGARPVASGPALEAFFPLVVGQAVPPAAGGGFELTVWMWEPEASELAARVPQL